jgi:hypothetical protein
MKEKLWTFTCVVSETDCYIHSILWTCPLRIPVHATPKLQTPVVWMSFKWLSLTFTFNNQLLELRFSAVTMESTIFYDVMQCNLVEVRQFFRETYCLYNQGWRVSQTSRSQTKPVSSWALACAALWPWRWRPYVHSKCKWTPSIRLHSVTSLKIVLLISLG